MLKLMCGAAAVVLFGSAAMAGESLPLSMQGIGVRSSKPTNKKSTSENPITPITLMRPETTV